MRGSQCTKCSQAPAQVISDAGHLCGECLHSVIRGKLNKAIKVNFALEHGDVALVAVSGGPCSMALAHMLHSFLLPDWSRPQAGKVACKLHVIHVDETAASRQSATQAAEYHSRMRAAVQSLESVYEQARIRYLEDAIGQHHGPDAVVQGLKDRLAASKDDTSRQDLVRALRQQILLSEARELGCNKLVVGDNSTGLAARFVSMSAQVRSVQGRGYASTAELSMVDAREEGCCVVRPFLAVPRKQLVLHSYFSEHLFLCNPMPESIKPSVTHQTEEFIADLYAARRNTVANITNLATKLRSFPFNDIAYAPDPPLRDLVRGSDRFRKRVFPASKGRAHPNPVVYHSTAGAPKEAFVLCKVCRSPVPGEQENGGTKDICDSCQRWILVDDIDDDSNQRSGLASGSV